MGIFHSPNYSQKWRWFGLTNPFSLQKFSSAKKFPTKIPWKNLELKKLVRKVLSFVFFSGTTTFEKIDRKAKPQETTTTSSLTVFPLTV